MFALRTKQGTAMAETALCTKHAVHADHYRAVLKAARQDPEWDGCPDLAVCDGNDALACVACGDPT